MSPRNEDFLFAQEAQRRGYLTEEQLDEGLLLQKRMSEELQLDERLAVILVKRGWLAEEQARRIYARIEPDDDHDEIQGYRIEEKIGHGAMGTVYKAEHLGLRRPVAIKILRRDLARDTIQVERLKEEAKLLASLDHPNIVRALDAGESRGFPFFVMEYVEGETIKEKLQRQGPLDEVEALAITRGIADALERARRMGVVHRDVKPGNVILSTKGEPKLMDLGLAKGPVDLGLTQHGATVGTPQFISPEQAQDPRRADTRSDIYSLGATLYAMVTGRPPFTGTTLAEVLTKVLYEAPVPPRVANKKVSPEVSYLIERMMLKDPALRYRTPADVVHDIDDLLAGRSIIPDGFTGNWEAYLLRQRIRRWTKVAAVAAVVLLVFGGGMFAYWNRLKHRRVVAEAEQEVEAALATAVISDGDDALTLGQKLLTARAALERTSDLSPKGWRQLENQAWAVEKQIEHFRLVQALGNEVRKLTAAGRFDQALAQVMDLKQRIPGADSPAEAVLDDLHAELRIESQKAFQTLRTRAQLQTSTSLTGFLAEQRAYRDALGAGLILDVEVKTAQEVAEQAVRALEAIERSLGTLEADLSGTRLREQLEALRLADLRIAFEEGRKQILDDANREWGPLAEEWIPWRVVRDHIVARVDVLEDVLRGAFFERWTAVRQKAVALHDHANTEEAKLLLIRFANAAKDANLADLERHARDLREELDEERRLALENAWQDYVSIRDEALEAFREGRPQAAARRVREALAATDARWPYRREIEGILQLAEAYQAMSHSALDGLMRLQRVEDVDMRAGPPERRWTVVSTHPDELAVIVRTSRGGPEERRLLADVAVDQLADWATPPDGTLPALERAAALLAGTPLEDPTDLRPTRKLYVRLVEAMREARYEGAFRKWAEERAVAAEIQQDQREADAREGIQRAEYYLLREEYQKAFNFVEELTRPGSRLQQTVAYDKQKARIAEWKERVEKEVANLELVRLFPGARIRVEGDETSIFYDFEDPLQLDSWRKGESRATGALEPYNSDRPITPAQNNHRLTLNRGVEGLILDRPLTLKSIFDPAKRIEVSFDLHTFPSPFLHIIDIDGLQVGVLSADPTGRAYRERWRFPEDVPLLPDEQTAPRTNWYGRGRGVAFHAGKGFGDPRDWEWPAFGGGRNHERWRKAGPRLSQDLYAFEPSEIVRVKVVREGGTITLFVENREVDSASSEKWAQIGRISDASPRGRRPGTGLIQILAWTPQGIDNLRVQGTVLERYREP